MKMGVATLAVVAVGVLGAVPGKDGVLKVTVKEKLDFVWVKITKK